MNWLARIFSMFRAPENEPDHSGGESLGLEISQDGIAWIAEFETGGKAYYESFLQSPTWPGGQSGVTIGCGYDLGYNSEEDIRRDWTSIVGRIAIEELVGVASITGRRAAEEVSQMSGIKVSWEDALKVFTRRSVPRFERIALQTFPGVEELPEGAQEALLSLVFNRGGSLKGDRRREMLAIRKICERYDDLDSPSERRSALRDIAKEIRAMKRLWPTGQRGLLLRRDQEAARVEEAAQQMGRSGNV